MYSKLIGIKDIRYIKLISYSFFVFAVVLDYYTGYELASSFFYFIPIILLASSYKTSLFESLFIAFLSGFSWVFIEYLYIEHYSHFSIYVWNGIVRQTTFLIIAYLFYQNKVEKKQLIERNILLDEISKEKNKFLGIAAHDLRNPISVIKSLSNLLLKSSEAKKLDDDQKQLIRLIETASTSSLSLINNLLDVSKIEAGIMSLNIEQVNYSDLVESVVKINSYLAKQKNQVIRGTISDNIILQIDKTKIEQVLNNLLSNAIKYSYPSTEIVVNVYSQDNFVVTEVIDKGVGLTVADKNDVFKPFKTFGSVPTGGESSTGLGLAIVRKIVLAHGGEVDFESNNEIGTKFFYKLPKNKI